MTTSQQFALYYITCPNQESAREIASILLNENLIACANIIPGIESIYRWKGAVASDQESILILKSKASYAESISNRVAELHSYECPCVIKLPITGGLPPYLQWLGEQTGGESPTT